MNKEKNDVNKSRKDQCDTCVGLESWTVSKEVNTAHQQKGRVWREAKGWIKEAGNKKTYAANMDLERVQILASLSYKKQSQVIIRQLFLRKGHTMMEAESVHSTLEHYFCPL